MVDSGQVPTTWLEGRVLATGSLSGTFAHVSHSRSLVILRRELKDLLVKFDLPDLDASTVRVSAPREVTQRISRYVYLCVQEEAPQFDGVYYLSKHGDDLENWGLFERASEPLGLLPAVARLLRPGHDDLERTMTHLGLTWFEDRVATG